MYGYLPKKILIYIVCCNITNKKYVTHTSNLTSRLSAHLNSYKNLSCMHISQGVFKLNNDNCIVSEGNLEKQNKSQVTRSVLPNSSI